MPQKIKPGSVVEIRDAVGNLTEMHASKCVHCEQFTYFPSMKKMHETGIDVCRSCMRLVCKDCAGKPCRPWLKEVERQEARSRMLRDIGF